MKIHSIGWIMIAAGFGTLLILGLAISPYFFEGLQTKCYANENSLATINRLYCDLMEESGLHLNAETVHANLHEFRAENHQSPITFHITGMKVDPANWRVKLFVPKNITIGFENKEVTWFEYSRGLGPHAGYGWKAIHPDGSCTYGTLKQI